MNQNRTIPVCLPWPPRPCLTIMESVGVCAVVLYLLPLLSRLCVEKAVPWLPGDQLGHRRACTAAVNLNVSDMCPLGSVAFCVAFLIVSSSVTGLASSLLAPETNRLVL